MLAPDRNAFFRAVREQLFSDWMSQAQVDGVNAILSAWDDAADPRFAAYALATAFHETAATMQPIAEYGRGAGRAYGRPAGPFGHVYYGRGFVQLTWLENYEKAKDKLGVDLVENPDLALQPDVAAKVMVHGMSEGWFTGRKLADFFRDGLADWTGARQIINGYDKAETIAGYGLTFLHAIEAAR
jgi:putative chitinase